MTVDHGLRPEAADEARQVGEICARWGVGHRIAAWSGDKPATGLAEAARLARYRLLAEAAAAAGTDLVLTGHTMDDQAETFAMRRARGEGRGLAGMARATLHRDRVWIARPLLAARRHALRAMLNEAGQRWIDDPSNESAVSERVRMRKALAGDPEAVERLAAQADAAAAARIDANIAAARILSRGAPAAPGLAGVPADLLLRGDGAALLAFRTLAAAVGGADHLPDEPAARRLLQRVAAGEAGGALARAVVTHARGALWFHREARGLPEPSRIAETALWDGRYRALAELDVALRGIDRARAAADDFGAPPRRLVTAALAAEPLGPEAAPSLVRAVPPWATFLPGFDVPLRNAAARLVGAAPVPSSPADAPPFPRHIAP